MPATTTQHAHETAPLADSRLKLERLDGGRSRPALVQAAAEHLLQLGQLARYMSEADGAALRAHFPQATSAWLQGLSATATQHQRLSWDLLCGAAGPPLQTTPRQQTTQRHSRPKKHSRPQLPTLDDTALPRVLGECEATQPPLAAQLRPQPPATPRAGHDISIRSCFGGGTAPQPSAPSLPAAAPRRSGAAQVALYVAGMVSHHASGAPITRAPVTLPPPVHGTGPPPTHTQTHTQTLPLTSTRTPTPAELITSTTPNTPTMAAHGLGSGPADGRDRNETRAFDEA